MKTSTERQRTRREKLNKIAMDWGFESWVKLETAALNGEVSSINTKEPAYYPDFYSIHGRDPIPYEDYDPNATLDEGDYHYYTGGGEHTQFRVRISVLIDDVFHTETTYLYFVEFRNKLYNRMEVEYTAKTLLDLQHWLRARGLNIYTIPILSRKTKLETTLVAA